MSDTRRIKHWAFVLAWEHPVPFWAKPQGRKLRWLGPHDDYPDLGFEDWGFTELPDGAPGWWSPRAAMYAGRTPQEAVEAAMGDVSRTRAEALEDFRLAEAQLAHCEVVLEKL